MVRQFLKQVLGTSYVLSHLHRERRTPYLPREELWRRRDARVRSLVRYAAATVPYYRELFRANGLDPRDIRSAADLDRLPLLHKATVRANPLRFVSQSARGRRSVPFATSGSTGSPLTVYHDQLSLIANLVHTEPEKEVIRKAAAAHRPLHQLDIRYSQSTVKKIQGFYRQALFFPKRPHRHQIDIERPLEEVVEAICSLRPQVLESYGSYLETLFRMADVGIVRFPPPRVVKYGADAMTGPGRQLIEERFGVRVLSRYNAVECLRIGFTCEHGRGYHLREDLCHLRLVDQRGLPVSPAQPGEIVVSNLVNHGTVLLNYRLGDLGVLSDEPCPCGRSLPLLTDLEGRVEDVLLLPGNRVVHPRAIWGLLKGRPEVLRYQLIQHEPERLEFRLLTRERPDFDRAVEELKGQVDQLLGPARIDFVFSEQLGRPTGGKFRAVISHCGAARVLARAFPGRHPGAL